MGAQAAPRPQVASEPKWWRGNIVSMEIGDFAGDEEDTGELVMQVEQVAAVVAAGRGV